MPQVFDYVEAGDVGAAEGRDRLALGEELLAGHELRTANGGRLIMQGDGNLVLYAPSGQPLWATDTRGKPATRAQFQKDGNLVIRSRRGYGVPEGTGYWDSGTARRGVTSLVFQTDGNLVWYAGRRAVSSTGTAGWRKSPNWQKDDGGWFSHALHTVEHAASDLAAPVRFVAKEAQKGITAIEKVPVLGTLAHAVVAGTGLGLVTNIASGARIDRAVVSDFKDKLRAAKESAPLAESIVSVVPGVGTGIAGALAFGTALAEAHRIDDALIASVRGALPGGALAQAAFDTANGLLHGQNITHAALAAARAQIPPEGRAAFDVAIAVAHGQNLQRAVMHAAATVAPSVLSNILPSGAASALARDFVHSVGSGSGVTLKNLAWQIGSTGPAFIPGLASVVSAGMANAAAIGRSEATKSIRLAAARGAIGSEARHGFDVGLGAVRGHLLGSSDLHAVREQLPGGDKAKGAFDAAVMIATNAGPEMASRLAAGHSDAARRTFLRVLEVHRRGPAVPIHLATSALPGVSRAVRVGLTVSPPEPTRAFPSLTAAQNKVAGAMMANPALRSMPAAGVARSLAVDTRDARGAIAAFLERFGATRELDYRDVGEMETFDQAARRHNVNAPNLGEWPGDTGEIHVVQMPAIPISRQAMHALYRRGDSNMRRAMLAHELLAHVARNTGELEGTTWTIRGNGDWPSKVAQTVVGDGSRWREILPLNPTFHVQANGNIPQWTPGRVVQLPPSWFPSAMPVAAATVSPAVSSSSAPSSSGPPFASAYPLGYPSSVYMNRAGDDGEKIAALITGDKNRWRELLATNPKLESAKFGIAIYEGKSIRLPSSWVKAQATPAIVVAGQTPEVLMPAPAGVPPGVPIEASPPVSPAPVPDGRIGSPVSKTGPVLAPAPVLTNWTEFGPPGTPRPSEAGPVVTGSAEQIATVQIMLGGFFRDHPDASYSMPSSPYGSLPEDFAGVWTDRTTAALVGFERWWNGKRNTPALETDGMPTGDAVQSLINQTAADGGSVDARQPIQLSVRGQEQRAATAPAKKGPGLAIPIALILAALGAG